MAKPKNVPLRTVRARFASPDADGIFETYTVNLEDDCRRMLEAHGKKLTPKLRAAIQRQCEDWQNNLPAELDRRQPEVLAVLVHRDSYQPEVIADAEEALGAVFALRAVTDLARQRDVMTGYWLGRCAERLAVAPHEPDAKRGKTTLAGAATGGRTRRKLSDAERAAAKTERDSLIQHGLTKTDASAVVSKRYAVSYKTISRL